MHIPKVHSKTVPNTVQSQRAWGKSFPQALFKINVIIISIAYMFLLQLYSYISHLLRQVHRIYYVQHRFTINIEMHSSGT